MNRTVVPSARNQKTTCQHSWNWAPAGASLDPGQKGRQQPHLCLLEKMASNTVTNTLLYQTAPSTEQCVERRAGLLQLFLQHPITSRTELVKSLLHASLINSIQKPSKHFEKGLIRAAWGPGKMQETYVTHLYCWSEAFSQQTVGRCMRTASEISGESSPIFSVSNFH